MIDRITFTIRYQADQCDQCADCVFLTWMFHDREPSPKKHSPYCCLFREPLATAHSIGDTFVTPIRCYHCQNHETIARQDPLHEES